MAITIALAGDTMLGRGVAERLEQAKPDELVADEVRDAAAEAELFVLNLECCISTRGEPWREPGKPFFFRAPPAAVDALRSLDVDCVTLANNHALDFGIEAMLDTREHLSQAGIQSVGAGATEAEARAPAVLDADGIRVGVVGLTDHPPGFAAGRDSPGVAYADLRSGVPDWTVAAVNGLRHPRDQSPLSSTPSPAADVVLVTPHWGPNMTPEPVPHVRTAARELTRAGATLIAGHSAHVFQAVAGQVLFDLGDFIDDYAVHPELRNDLGLLFLVTLDEAGPVHIEAVPLALDFCFTRLAVDGEYAWIRDRFAAACAAWGGEIAEEKNRLVVYSSTG